MSEPTKLPPLTHSPDDAGRRLGVSTRTIYNLLATGELKSFKLGKLRRIPDPELERLVARNMAESA